MIPGARGIDLRKQNKGTIIVYNNDMPQGSDIVVGVNGNRFTIQEGKEVIVPSSVIDVLNDAIIEEPIVDALGRIQTDENGNMKMRKKNRFIVNIIKDPKNTKRGRPKVKQEPEVEDETPEMKVLDEYKEPEHKKTTTKNIGGELDEENLVDDYDAEEEDDTDGDIQ